jgi:hypothetical protein
MTADGHNEDGNVASKPPIFLLTSLGGWWLVVGGWGLAGGGGTRRERVKKKKTQSRYRSSARAHELVESFCTTRAMIPATS